MHPFIAEKPDRLETARLVMRPIRLEDSPAFFDIFSDEETLRFWSGETLRDLEQARTLVCRELELSASDNCINWGIALPGPDRLIGKFTLFQFHAQNRRAEVGYILDRRFWGKGYMTEAMGEILAYAFNDLELHRLEADSDPGNEASLALLRKFGFEREGYFRERWHVNGNWLDSVMFGLLREDWRRLNHA